MEMGHRILGLLIIQIGRELITQLLDLFDKFFGIRLNGPDPSPHLLCLVETVKQLLGTIQNRVHLFRERLGIESKRADGQSPLLTPVFQGLLRLLAVGFHLPLLTL